MAGPRQKLRKEALCLLIHVRKSQLTANELLHVAILSRNEEINGLIRLSFPLVLLSSFCCHHQRISTWPPYQYYHSRLFAFSESFFYRLSNSEFTLFFLNKNVPPSSQINYYMAKITNPSIILLGSHPLKHVSLTCFIRSTRLNALW